MELEECQSCVGESMRTEFDAPLTRQKYITNHMLDKHGRTPLCTRCSWGTGSHSSECRARFEAICTKELAEAEVARAANAVPRGPDVRESEPVESSEAAGQLAAMEGELAGQRLSWMTRVSRNPWGCRWNKAPRQVLRSELQKHN